MIQTALQQGSVGPKGILFLAMELGKSKWGLTFGPGNEQHRRVEIEARAWVMFDGEVAKARRKFGLSEECRVVSCYEAGRDGFWIHRRLRSVGIENLVFDASSIEVPRRKRRAKTDRMDGESLLRLVIRYEGGDRRACRVVNVPSEEWEDGRRLHREEERLQKEKRGHQSRIGSLLALEGIVLPVGRDFLRRLGRVRRWNGTGLGEDLEAELRREYGRWEVVSRQLREVSGEKKARLKDAREAKRQGAVGPEKQEVQEKHEKVSRLMSLGGIGERGAWVLGMEFFGWREFRNGKQVGSLAGLTGTPYASGGTEREQGISKAGNRRVRALMVELAWAWLRYQPRSKIARWYEERFGKGGKRTRRVGIVAVARKLLVALWRFWEFGEVPEGAELKSA